MEKTNTQSTFGRNVRTLRKDRGLSQERLAELIQKSVDTVSNIERGFSSTRIKTAEDIAEALGVPLKELFAVGPDLPEDIHRQAIIERFIGVARTCDGQTLDAIMDAVDVVVRVADDPKRTKESS